MRIKKLVKISVTYNAIGKYRDPTEIRLPGGSALLFPFTFCPSKRSEDKSPKNVTSEDPNFRKIMSLVSDPNLETIDVFVGKKRSGSIKIIKLFHEMLPTVWHKIRWFACEHDIEEKLALLESLGVSRDSPRIFRIMDNVHPCRDAILLLGSVYSELDAV